MSRRTKLTPKVQERIVAAVAEGRSPEAAASVAAVDRATLYRWLTRFRDFCDKVTEAQTQAANRRITEQIASSARKRLDEARLKFDQLKLTAEYDLSGRSVEEVKATLEISNTTANALRNELRLISAPSLAARRERSGAVLRSASELIAGYASGFQVPVGDPRFALAAFLGLETGRAWKRRAVRTGRLHSKAAVLEVRP